VLTSLTHQYRRSLVAVSVTHVLQVVCLAAGAVATRASVRSIDSEIGASYAIGLNGSHGLQQDDLTIDSRMQGERQRNR
jgi:hypothetical protein